MTDNSSQLQAARMQLEAMSENLPKGKLTFPSVEELHNKEFTVSTLQRWLEELNVVEDKLLQVSELHSMIRNNLSAQQFRKKMIQAASDIKSPTEFERHFLKKHWDIHRLLHDWDEVRSVAASVVEVLKLRQKALDRNITCMRSLINTIRSSNILRVQGSDMAEEPSEPSKQSHYSDVEEIEGDQEEPQTEIIGGLSV